MNASHNILDSASIVAASLAAAAFSVGRQRGAADLPRRSQGARPPGPRRRHADARRRRAAAARWCRPDRRCSRQQVRDEVMIARASGELMPAGEGTAFEVTTLLDAGARRGARERPRGARARRADARRRRPPRGRTHGAADEPAARRVRRELAPLTATPGARRAGGLQTNPLPRIAPAGAESEPASTIVAPRAPPP